MLEFVMTPMLIPPLLQCWHETDMRKVMTAELSAFEEKYNVKFEDHSLVLQHHKARDLVRSQYGNKLWADPKMFAKRASRIFTDENQRIYSDFSTAGVHWYLAT